MLNGTEKKLMSAIVNLCTDKESVLISPIDLINISKIKDVDSEKVDGILNDLSMDGYFDLVMSDRHGEKVYCINLLEKGKGYLRSRKVAKRNIIFRVCLSVSLAFLSFIIGLILKKIF